VKHPDLLPAISERQVLDEEIEKELRSSLESFLKGFKQEAV